MLECPLSQFRPQKALEAIRGYRCAEKSNTYMNVSVIILNWNAATDTIACIQQFAGWQRIRPTIWVVDNASQDGSPALIAQQHPHIHLLRNTRNQGFAGGTNRGIEAALQKGDAPLLLLNNDARIEEEALTQLITSLCEDPTIGVIGPLLYLAKQPDTLIAAGSRNLVLHIHNLNKHPPVGCPVFPVEYISGSVALIRAQLLREIGLLDERYFFNVEVADLCRRARQRGYSTMIAAHARAYHDLDRSSPLRGTLHTYYLIRNRFLYIRKFYQASQLPLLAFWATYSGLLACKLALGGQRTTAQAVWLGVNDGLAGRFDGQNSRVLAVCTGKSAPP
jgi:GT2 family glycosyltransferase